MKYITLEQLILMHDVIIDKFGGSHGIRDKEILYYIIDAPFGSFYGEEFYKEIIDKIIIFVFCLIKDHPFIDGNKRIAFHCFILLCKLNNIKLKYTNDLMIECFLKLAQDMTKEKFKEFVDKIICK